VYRDDDATSVHATRAFPRLGLRSTHVTVYAIGSQSGSPGILPAAGGPVALNV